MVIDDVHDDADVVIGAGLDQVAEFADTNLSIERIGGIGTLDAVVVEGVVVPVVGRGDLFLAEVIPRLDVFFLRFVFFLHLKRLVVYGKM